MKRNFLLLLIIISTLQDFANVSLPKIFGDNMVLQRNKLIPVWGWADPHEKITIRFNHQTKSVTADKDGNWNVNLDKESAGGPFQLVVKGKNTITVKNVLVGEVWICSGQSNMEMPIEGWGKVNNYEREIAAANYPQIRHIKIPNTVNTKPQKDITQGEWKVCSPSTAGDFTAAGYFFARELYDQLKIPIGLINSSWGGTHVETWTSRQAFANSEEFKTMIAQMPLLNLDSLAAVRKEALVKKINGMQGSLPSATDTASWRMPEFADSRWPQMQLPSLWEQRQLGDLDGVVWFRKTVDVSADQAGKEATIELAMIDDNDITYVNGVRVGATNSYNTHRNYQIPPGVLKSGKNVIAVRVEDTGGGGGIYGDSSAMKLNIGSDVISLAGNWQFAVEQIYGGGNSVGPNTYPTLLFNAMINPLIPYAFEGVIWYQGEANAGRAYQYRKAFPLMITDWRKHWGDDFPFYFVQLASFNADNGNSSKGSSWAELREAQAMTLSLPNTGMAVTTDIGNPTDIHPKDKQDVGKRLAAIALHNVYKKEIIFSGPTYKSMKVEGTDIAISFTNVGTGLMVRNGELKGFEIAGLGQQFFPATARIRGDEVVVHCEQINHPVAVRFGWKDDAGEDNLFNKEGFPAPPFRTDKWKGVTEGQKFSF